MQNNSENFIVRVITFISFGFWIFFLFIWSWLGYKFSSMSLNFNRQIVFYVWTFISTPVFGKIIVMLFALFFHFFLIQTNRINFREKILLNVFSLALVFLILFIGYRYAIEPVIQYKLQLLNTFKPN